MTYFEKSTTSIRHVTPSPSDISRTRPSTSRERGLHSPTFSGTFSPRNYGSLQQYSTFDFRDTDRPKGAINEHNCYHRSRPTVSGYVPPVHRC